MPIQPIFLFSITRSGSTLVQRVIAAHAGVATTSEPWLLLPYIYALREQGVVAEYTQRLSVAAIEDFCRELPGGVEEYRREVRNLALRLYASAAGPHATHFVDKTPPYYFIADEIVRMFPEARFVFLWRNPLSIVASISETWHDGHWRVTGHAEDLFVGLPRLLAVYGAHREQVLAVRFEDLVSGEEGHWRALMEHVGIPFEPAALERFASVSLNGRMGDPIGPGKYAALNPATTQKWRETLANPLRRAWCRRYLRFLGRERLALMGYDYYQLLDELEDLPMTTTSLLGDLAQLASDVAREPWRAQVRRRGVGGPSVLRELLRS